MRLLSPALPQHRSREELYAGLDEIKAAPQDPGIVRLIVRRPTVDGREVVPDALVTTNEGVQGDNWKARGSSRTPTRQANPNAQITLMNSRAIATIAGLTDFWPLAGDQFFVDLDLSTANLPTGTQVRIGSSLIEITPDPHLGCKKFAARFGRDALDFVNSPIGRELRLRGLNAKVIEGGTVRLGDTVARLS